MNRSIIYVSSCMAVSALLFPSFVDQAHAACNPPKDVSSCRIANDIFKQPSPALPEAPFLAAHPQTGETLVMTNFDRGEPVPGHTSCNPSNAQGCASVSSVDLMNGAVAKPSGPFLIRFPDGRALLATPMP